MRRCNVEADAFAGPCLYPCRYDGRPCEVVAAFAGALRRELLIPTPGAPMVGTPTADQIQARFTSTIGRVSRRLPCWECRGVEDDIVNLAKVRLGKHERRILLSAPQPGSPFAVIESGGRGRSADEANRRAIRKLDRVGLLELGSEEIQVKTRAMKANGRWPIHRTYRRRAVRLSLLGNEFVERTGTALRYGGEIRWSQHQAALMAACRRPTSELLANFRAEIVRTAFYASQLAKSPFAGPENISDFLAYSRVARALELAAPPVGRSDELA